MKKMFRKAVTALGSAALIGATVGTAAAAYPEGFTSNTALVTGANSAASDGAAASKIAAALNAENAGTTTTTLTGASGVTEDEVVFGTLINATAYKIESTLTDSKVPSLMDEKFSWDDGNGADDIDMHEELIIGDMKIITSLDDEDLTGVALTNEMGFEYRYVFDDALNISGVGDTEADTLYLTILGEEYEIESATATSMTVVTSEEHSLSIGESVTFDGTTLTIDDIYDGKALVNGEVITEGNTKKVDGVRVNVDTVGYHTNTPEKSKVILKVGDDISKTYTDGDEYIGEDEDDPLWVWDIDSLGSAAGYIGVKYNVNINDADDDDAGDSIKYVGGSYMLPDAFGEVKLVGTTDVDYENVKVKFADVDLYNVTDASTANEDEEVIVISGDTESTITAGAEETDEIYIWFAIVGEETNSAASTYGQIEVFYRDHDGDNTPTNKARYETRFALTSNKTLARTNIATIDVGDTTVDIDMSVAAATGIPTLYFENPDDGDINLTIGGTAITDLGAAGVFDQFGITAEDADALDVVVAGTDVSTKEESIMDYYGIIVAEDDSKGVEGNADDDELVLSIPDDQVYAEVSVLAGGEASSSSTGIMTYKDTETEKFADMNLVVVGGSAINSVAATLLGGSYSDAMFTDKTGVKAGEFLIESFDYNDNTALLVAGYNAADTTKAAEYLVNSDDVDTTVGKKYTGTSSTEASLYTA